MWTHWAKEELSGWRKDLAEVSYVSSLEIFISYFVFTQYCGSKKKNAGEEEIASVPDKNQNMVQEET